MKDGERLVWAAAFALVIAGIDTANEDPAYLQSRLAEAIGRGHSAVTALRNTARACEPFKDGKHAEAWAMLRDMAGESN
jgi:hypothetical protein